jgi:hypothetical protein
MLILLLGHFGVSTSMDEDTRKSSNEISSVEGNYSTVDEDTRKSSNERLSVEGNYSTVDEDTRKSSNERSSVEGNYSTVDGTHISGTVATTSNINFPAGT